MGKAPFAILRLTYFGVIIIGFEGVAAGSNELDYLPELLRIDVLCGTAFPHTVCL